MPFGPLVDSNSTCWPSCRLLNPSPWMVEKCTNTSALPSVGVMKPKPLASLNHFTVPLCIVTSARVATDGTYPVLMILLKERLKKIDVAMQRLHGKYIYSSCRHFNTCSPCLANRGSYYVKPFSVASTRRSAGTCSKSLFLWLQFTEWSTIFSIKP